MTHQVDIIVKDKAQDVFIQLLLDCTGKILFFHMGYYTTKIRVRNHEEKYF